ncbi:MAG: radical SAM protein [Betaproteobacteria bacterium]|nr:radical SAM protein [Gammaproteobacteria bacterium]MDH3438077.1 radical SAM protein [Betaproteobacteria bacterium]
MRELIDRRAGHGVSATYAMRPFTAMARLVEARWASPGVRQLVNVFYRIKSWELLLRNLLGARNRELTEQRFCEKPFEHFESTETGSVHLCCSFWLPAAVGDLNSDSPRDIWNSERAQDIRRDILKGSFKYCDAELCVRIRANSLPTVAQAKQNPVHQRIIENKITRLDSQPTFFNLSHDRSCNLACPSCRTRKIAFNEGSAYVRRKRIHDKVVGAFLDEATNRAFTLQVTSSGDAFGSRIFREFLQDLDGSKFPNMKVWLQTNGVLFTDKMWSRIGRIHGNIEYLYVSIDAASEATYNITRRGGHWGQLLKNMEHLSPLCRQSGIKLQFHFVVQQANYREMADFVEIGRRYQVDSVHFMKVVNWGTWTVAQFEEVGVWRPDHAEFAEFLRMLSRPIFDDTIVSLGNLTQEHALAKRRYSMAH